jgi:hypothetical protein
MGAQPNSWLAPAELLAGIAVARSMAAGRSLDAALLHVRLGPADLASLDYEGATRLADRHGWEVFSAELDDPAAVRATLTALMVVTDPDWSRQADRGRERALNGLDDDAVQCFRLGGLLDVTEQAIEWWLGAARWRRARRDERKRAAGLDAERRSLELEKRRLDGTGLTVSWVAVEDSTAGYDIQTWREANDHVFDKPTSDGRLWRRHYVEVKSALAGEEVFITRGEWDFAAAHSESWTLQVWRKVDTPSEIPVDRLAPHVPVDNGRGRWESFRVSSTVLRS